jgi:hypothetical protein
MSTSLTFRHLDSPDDGSRAFDIMKDLRPHLTDPDTFCAQLDCHDEGNYRPLAACDAEDKVRGRAGYRAQTNTLYRCLSYLDDLVVTSRVQRSVIGSECAR